jgi:hypothetical protein
MDLLCDLKHLLLFREQNCVQRTTLLRLFIIDCGCSSWHLAFLGGRILFYYNLCSCFDSYYLICSSYHPIVLRSFFFLTPSYLRAFNSHVAVRCAFFSCLDCLLPCRLSFIFCLACLACLVALHSCLTLLVNFAMQLTLLPFPLASYIILRCSGFRLHMIGWL